MPITDAALDATLRRVFPRFSEALRTALHTSATARRLDAGETVMTPGGVVRSVPLILGGAVEVTRAEPGGDGEVLLYYLEPGETCAASLACCTSARASVVGATAALPTTLLMVPAELVERWVVSHPDWRAFVLATYTARFDELLGAVDALAFDDLGARLLANLRAKARLSGAALAVTHQQLATELNTSRVVVSRLLKAMERRGEVRLGRSEVVLVGA